MVPSKLHLPRHARSASTALVSPSGRHTRVRWHWAIRSPAGRSRTIGVVFTRGHNSICLQRSQTGRLSCATWFFALRKSVAGSGVDRISLHVPRGPLAASPLGRSERDSTGAYVRPSSPSWPPWVGSTSCALGGARTGAGAIGASRLSRRAYARAARSTSATVSGERGHSRSSAGLASVGSSGASCKALTRGQASHIALAPTFSGMIPGHSGESALGSRRASFRMDFRSKRDRLRDRY